MSCMMNDSKGSKVAAEKDEQIYHEKQSRELCALHALNNLFQKAKTFTKKQLDEICKNLAPGSYINPHRSILGLGNYDVNVIMSALQLRGFDTLWFDKRRDPSELQLDRVYGFILNIPTDMKWGMVHVPIQRKHWIAVRCIHNSFYSLDSKQDQPELIGSDEQLTSYLREQIQNCDKEVLMVVSQQLQRDVWRNTVNCDTKPASQSEGSIQSSQSETIPTNVQFKESGV